MRQAASLHHSLVALGRWLQAQRYRFTTVTPATHARVLAHERPERADVRDAFGWNRPFHAALLPRELLTGLEAAGLVQEEAGLWRSRVRFGALCGLLCAHSGYPTREADAVFFGPDTYRFAALIRETLAREPVGRARVLDLGCGSGAGGLVAARLLQGSLTGLEELVLADINPRALDFASANATLAGAPRTHCVESDLFTRVQGDFDLIVSNPPYLVDAQARTYRHGGGPLGGELTERIVAGALPRLRPGGRLVLYSGAPIVAGRDPLREALHAVVDEHGWPMSYRELDPDVFGEELEQPAYAGVERIAVVGAVVQRPRA